MRIWKFVIVFTWVFSMSAIGAEGVDAEKRALIDTLLKQTGQSSIEMGKQFSNVYIQQMTMLLKRSNPDVDPKAYEIVQDVVSSIIDEELVKKDTLNQMMYPIYSKHFTVDELKKMIELNNTEFGKKMIKVMPLITQEGMQAGQQFGQTLGPKIQQALITRFEAAGIE